jgi:hypothetical protein
MESDLYLIKQPVYIELKLAAFGGVVSIVGVYEKQSLADFFYIYWLLGSN